MQEEGRSREVVITAVKALSQVGPPGVLGQARHLLLPLCHRMRRIGTEKHPLCKAVTQSHQLSGLLPAGGPSLSGGLKREGASCSLAAFQLLTFLRGVGFKDTVLVTI